MHTRRFTTLILGMWLAGSLFMIEVAIWNFQGVDRLLEAPGPEASQMVKVLGSESTRMLLRYQAAELNRFYFDTWEITQLLLGMVLIVTVVFAATGDKYYLGLSGFLLLLVIVEHFLITPQITSLGRLIDFIPADEPSADRIRFWRFHNAYSTLEILKLIALGAITFRLLAVSNRRRSRSRKKVNLVDDADHG